VSVEAEENKSKKGLFTNGSSLFRPYKGDKAFGIGKRMVIDSKSLVFKEQDSVFSLSENINKILLEESHQK
jgi:hypothetical protein